MTETHIWYNVLDDGTFLLCQIIHSSVGLWYPTVQFTCRIYDPKTKENIWRSANVSNFVAPAPGSSDRRTCKSDSFSIQYKPATDTTEDTYVVIASPTDDLKLTLEVTRPKGIPGFKLGKGPKGGYSYYGPDLDKPEGYVMHQFWPRTKCSANIMIQGKAITQQGDGMVVHAIQGMRPNLVAARWNFAFFESKENEGATAIMMELTTTPDFGKHGNGSGGVKINVGSVVIGGKLLAVTGETIWPGETPDPNADVQSRAVHLDSKKDKDTGYEAPTRLTYHWSGPSVDPSAPGTVKAVLDLPVGDPTSYNGLIGKIDVLAEIPKVIKAVIAYAAGTKPYIYTWFNPSTLSVTLPGGEKVEVNGVVFNEATFIS